MDLAHFRVLIHELLNKYTDIVLEEAPMIILDIKSAFCMDNNGKDKKYTRHISIRMHFAWNGEKCKMHNIYWCSRDLKLAYVATNNVGGHDLTPRIKYIMVILDN